MKSWRRNGYRASMATATAAAINAGCYHTHEGTRDAWIEIGRLDDRVTDLESARMHHHPRRPGAAQGQPVRESNTNGDEP